MVKILQVKSPDNVEFIKTEYDLDWNKEITKKIITTKQKYTEKITHVCNKCGHQIGTVKKNKWEPYYTYKFELCGECNNVFPEMPPKWYKFPPKEVKHYKNAVAMIDELYDIAYNPRKSYTGKQREEAKHKINVLWESMMEGETVKQLLRDVSIGKTVTMSCPACGHTITGKQIPETCPWCEFDFEHTGDRGIGYYSAKMKEKERKRKKRKKRKKQRKKKGVK